VFNITPAMLAGYARRVHAVTQNPASMQAVNLKAGILRHPGAATPTLMPGDPATQS
jgi:hypothetical protein